MGSDRITIIYGNEASGCAWRVYRRGQSTPLQQGVLAGVGEPVPEALSGHRAGVVTLALPASQVVIRILQLPVSDPQELAGAVALQVDKLSPFPVEQIVYSHEVLAQTEAQTTVLIALAQRSSVGNWGNVFRQAGAEIARVDCGALGLWRMLESGGDLDTGRRESFLFLDQGEGILLTHDAGQLLSVSGLGPVGDYGDAEACEDLAEEVVRILMETDAEHGTGHKPRLMVAAAGPDMETLRTVLASICGIPVVFYPGETLPDAIQGVLQRSLMLPSGPRPLNLVPPEWRQDAATLQWRKKMIVAGSALLGLWFLLLAGGWGYLVWQRARLESLREAEAEWRRPANAVRGLRLQANLIDRYRDRSKSALESLREISLLQPQGVDLLSFTYRKGEGIELIGEADSGALVLQFNQRLNESMLFGDVRTGPRSQTRQGRHRFSFEISLGEVVP